MGAALHFEVLADCPLCRVESAVVEVFDGRSILSGFGVPLEARCRFCDARWEGATEPALPAVQPVVGRCPACKAILGPTAPETRSCAACGLQAVSRQTGAQASLESRADVEARLLAFALEEGYEAGQELLDEAFCEVSIDELVGRLRRGEPVQTSFDVFHFLFGHVSGGAVTVDRGGEEALREAAYQVAPRDSSVGRDPRAILYPIVSVMAADGSIDPAEERFVSAFLEAEGQTPLEPHEIRVHRPAEVERHIPRARRREIVELMIQLATIDGYADTSELRLAKAYANAWGIPEDDLVEWVERYREAHTSSARRFLLKLKSFFFGPTAEPAAATEVTR